MVKRMNLAFDELVSILAKNYIESQKVSFHHHQVLLK